MWANSFYQVHVKTKYSTVLCNNSWRVVTTILALNLGLLERDSHAFRASLQKLVNLFPINEGWTPKLQWLLFPSAPLLRYVLPKKFIGRKQWLDGMIINYNLSLSFHLLQDVLKPNILCRIKRNWLQEICGTYKQINYQNSKSSNRSRSSSILKILGMFSNSFRGCTFFWQSSLTLSA